MTRTRILPISLVLLALCSNVAHAWIRSHYEDATVVGRSELIVVAHLKENTIQYVPHKKKPHEGASQEHHAVLVITEVLKGTCDRREIPIIIHYGLTPIVGGYVKRKSFMIDRRRGDKAYPKDVIEIVATGKWHGPPPLVKDVRNNHLWFLRRRSGFCVISAAGLVGVSDLGIRLAPIPPSRVRLPR